MGLTALVGGGVMGEALLSGLLRSGRAPDDLAIVERHTPRADELTARYGVKSLPLTEAAGSSDTLILVVKPQDMAMLCEQISGHLPAGVLVVSLAAGITTTFLQERLPKGTAVVRVMPNTPALVDEGMAALSAGAHCGEAQLQQAEGLMRSVGKVLRVPEHQQDAVTALSGSGPAYVFYVVEAMIEAGVHLGLPRAVAAELTVQTVVGAGKMLRETGEHPAVLRGNVTSPGGTTAAAVRELEQHQVRAAFLAALAAARDRSRELGS